MTAAPADPVGVRWRRWAAMLVGPAIVVGVLAYPDVQTATMPLPLALGVVLIVAAAIVMSGRFRLMILLPIVSAFLPSPEIGFASYLLVKIVGTEHGIGLTGLLGGLVSSTAVTLGACSVKR